VRHPQGGGEPPLRPCPRTPARNPGRPDRLLPGRAVTRSGACKGSNPMTESCLARHPIEILAAEFVERHRRGERPSVTEYTVRHPDLAERIRSLFAAVVMMEDLKYGRPPGTPEDFPFRGRVPERLGEYRILKEIGRGGMGIVYEAEQESLGRR